MAPWPTPHDTEVHGRCRDRREEAHMAKNKKDKKKDKKKKDKKGKKK